MNYRFPFTPYPKGWYRIMLRSGKTHAFGRNFKIQCFHKNWIGVDTAHSAKTYPVIQQNDEWYIFFDPDDQPPFFAVPQISEFKDRHWQRPFNLVWRARTHAQEIAENALDLSHFCTVHTYQTIPELSQFHIDKHTFNVIMHSRRQFLGCQTQTSMDITYYGMGIVIANVKASAGICLKILLTTTPIDVENVEIRMTVAIKKTRNILYNLLLKTILPNEIKKEFTRDIPVWEAKIYRAKPLLCNKEGNIVRIRKWAQQFYSVSELSCLSN